ncbi:FAD/NAD(P)-binding protein [Commensalibacter communis]|uniref:Uncharacterized NAD(P)/FAD-binding protein YdhS (YdhS) n=1 Tax=Commensalibacter communis TaxID=2972786 RepID=A0A9W4TMB2_9PROT|nr:FAD/NAD(P)-binding protein [Commensalibacter communis]CAI3922095.1 Uncharacterized NAD(P)/FAD-binding protein YdhS (YdhS) [Commensalibacter communis]CAI3922213.1 Uncharacterized NAD(P)/FAD-binding protein YdhS (YdhS) [Commensalibacter communis]CAI3922242.1 Uncharacterized NAD(P)/FAD-binding protein YdhS (YdhS) [Commensalibacter communis]CAI3933041.1 Uncharacterized NAD(P)/FAD-binding protein YdhS (YdhS) [Commensalibacter communis]CAI3940758.1 Uncharacterized NAD(P)/FAD-binding protein YdhS 
MQQDKITISIIGVGPRGINLFERIIAHCFFDKKLHGKEITIQLFNNNSNYGMGCHDINQSENLLVNTICNQITTFPDESVLNYKFSLKGPSFYEWLQNKYKNNNEFKIDPLGYYSRKELGNYLCWSFNFLYSIELQHVNFIKIVDTVTDIQKGDDNNWILSTTDTQYLSDFVFITTGHDCHEYTFSNKKKMYAYPLTNIQNNVDANDIVAIQGIGLTTFDVIATLTEDRGGKYIKQSDRYTYLPSGKEPKIVAFARSGLPLSARGKSYKELREQYKAEFFTREKILALQKQNKKDFQKDYLPLILQDMEYVYSFTFLKNKDIIKAYNFLNDYMMYETEREVIIDKYIPNKEDQFSWEKISNPLLNRSFETQEDFDKWLLNYLNEDVDNAMQGNTQNPIKACTDILRDIRDLIRLCVNHGNLTEESAIWFNNIFVPIMNRICVGPPVERIQQMLALVEAGILTINLGPNVQVEEKKDGFYLHTTFNTTIKSDFYVVAKVYTPLLDHSENSLVKNILNNNISCQFKINNYQYGQFNVDDNFNLVDDKGNVIKSIYALGVPTEGAKFYTYILPRPFVNSTALYDAEVCVNHMFSHITKN